MKFAGKFMMEYGAIQNNVADAGSNGGNGGSGIVRFQRALESKE